MYHHQVKNSSLSSRISVPTERHLFLQSTNVAGDTGLGLSTDAKPRLKWTAELHKRFIEAVHQHGGVDKATPKTVLRLMGIPGLTLYHLKSHLQKYRLSKNLHAQTKIGSNKNGCMSDADRMSAERGGIISNTDHGSQTSNLQMSEALQMQIEVQRRIHEQLEVQRHLQLRIEAQGKYLQSVLEKAQETLGRQNLGSVGLETTKVQLSELVSKVSTECLNSAFSEMPSLCTQPTQTTQIADNSMDSCLTSCEVSQKDQEINNVSMGLRKFHGNGSLYPKETEEDSRPGETEPSWCEDLNESKMISSEKIVFPVRGISSDLSMSISVKEEKQSSRTLSEGRWKESDEDTLLQQLNKKRSAHLEIGRQSKEQQLPYLKSQLDLNAHAENDAASSCKQFNLNGFRWS
ncbi:myb-related protein 2-like isoform X2 [Tasmannia lanceolata]|uniref:myb-related protein 2-like isoform X2 n=1 Tax=Tasmannia lanceolata TaxID=3420 RepID=UPI004062AF50